MAYQLASAFVTVTAKNELSAAFSLIKSQVSGLLTGIGNISPVLGAVAGFASLTYAINQAMGAAEEAIDTETRLTATIRASGDAARISAEEVLAMSAALQQRGIFGNTQITAATAKLLQMRAITRDSFEEIISLSTDVAAAGFGSVETAAGSLGRSLADPARGLFRLRSIGIIFTKSEQDKIRALSEANNILGAQRVILDKVRDAFGGFNEAMAKTPAGQWKQIKNDLGDIAEMMGKKIYPIAVDIARQVLNITRPIGWLIGMVLDINSALGNWPVRILLAVGAAYGLVKAYMTLKSYTLAVYADLVRMSAEMYAILWGRMVPMMGHMTQAPGLIYKIQSAWASLNATMFTSWLSNPIFAGIALILSALVLVAAEVYLIYKFISSYPKLTEAVAEGWYLVTLIAQELWESLKRIGEMIFYIGMDIVDTFAPWLREIPLLKQLFEDGIVGAVKYMINMITDGLVIVGAFIKMLSSMVEDLMFNIRAITSGEFNFASPRNPFSEFADEYKRLDEALKKRIADRNKQKAAPAKEPRAMEGLGVPGGLSGLQDAWRNVQSAIMKKDNPAERTAAGIQSIDATADEMLNQLTILNTKVGGGAVATV